MTESECGGGIRQDGQEEDRTDGEGKCVEEQERGGGVVWRANRVSLTIIDPHVTLVVEDCKYRQVSGYLNAPATPLP